LKKRIWIISFSPIGRDPRLMRQIWALNDDYRLTVFGYDPDPELDGVDFVSIGVSERSSWREKMRKGLLLALRRYEPAYWSNPTVARCLEAVQGRPKPDLVLANDIEALPAAARVAGESPILFDAHEFFPRQFEDKALWKLLVGPYNSYLGTTYVPRTARMMTVCEGIAEHFQELYGTLPQVITNAPPQASVSPGSTQESSIRMIHHGAAVPGRRIESMIKMMKKLDARFTLDLMLVNSIPPYLAKLKRLARRNPRIRFVNPVPMPAIAETINAYDVGVYLLRPRSLNMRHALPNKFFEFIQGRLAVAIGPSPEMKRIVEEYGIGVVSERFTPSSLARKLNSLTQEDLMKYKHSTETAAEALSFEQNRDKLRAIVGETMASHVGGPCE
jgi:hypothetical protein